MIKALKHVVEKEKEKSNGDAGGISVINIVMNNKTPNLEIKKLQKAVDFLQKNIKNVVNQVAYSKNRINQLEHEVQRLSSIIRSKR